MAQTGMLNTPGAAQQPNDPGALAEWTVHPLRCGSRRVAARRVALIAAVVMLGVACVRLLFGAWLPCLAAAGLLLASISEYLLPSRYLLTTRGISVSGPGRRLSMEWNQVRRVVVRRNGALLSPFAAASRLDSYRGLFVRFGPEGSDGGRAQVMAAVQRYAAAASGTDPKG